VVGEASTFGRCLVNVGAAMSEENRRSVGMPDLVDTL